MVRHVERNRVLLTFFQRAPQLIVDQDLFADYVRHIKEWRSVTRHLRPNAHDAGGGNNLTSAIGDRFPDSKECVLREAVLRTTRSRY
jgi:hypothetical protein